MSTEYEERETGGTKLYRALGQGIAIFHEHRESEVDIIAVPGLGANPKECWTWSSYHEQTQGKAKPAKAVPTSEEEAEPRLAAENGRKFNWLRDADGLASLFPKSRIMLYDYASAWTGKRKVRATMKSICHWLLVDLREKRKSASETTRPLIFIGHSMGGVVIAKTLCIASARKEFEPILTCTVGCAFFGAPFRGSNMAKLALQYSSVFGHEAYEALLSFMKSESNDVLDEVTNDFMEISGKLSPRIELLCIWEQVPTGESYSNRIAQKIPQFMVQKAIMTSARAVLDWGTTALGAGTHFVEKESAVLQGAQEFGMTADHRDLIRFESITTERFVPVKAALSLMIRNAKIHARKRAFSSGQNLLTQKTVIQVCQSLEGIDMHRKFREKAQQRQVNSWLTTEPMYQLWLTNGNVAGQSRPHLWLKGAPGVGKTNASLAAIQEITKGFLTDRNVDSAADQSETFLAYFLCDGTSGCCAAEDLLKSLITQIIIQEESLAQHAARWFVPNSRHHSLLNGVAELDHESLGGLGAKATATVDNLWKCLQDIIEDPAVGKMYFILNNIHFLETGGSTTALLIKLRDSLDQVGDSVKGKVKWLITSRDETQIVRYLTAPSMALIDLDDNQEYGTKLRDARRQHAKEAVSLLQSSKSYTSGLAYVVGSSIERQSEDETWIDVLCILLGDMPNDSSNLAIRKWLRDVGKYSSHKLIDYTWDQTLSQNEDATLEIEELLNAMTIAYEPPTLADLAVLTDIQDQKHLIALIKKCSTILEINQTDEHKGKVTFTNAEFGRHMSTICHGQPDASNENRQKREYHGLMALRCFDHIKATYKSTAGRSRLANVAAGLMRTTTVTARIDEEANVLDVTADDDEAGEVVTVQSNGGAPDCSYPVKYLFRHLSEGYPDVVSLLYEDDPDFWGQTSRLRNIWLRDFEKLTTALKDIDTRGMSALHVAAGIGALELVSLLVDKNSKSSLNWTSNSGMTPLHVAACNNHVDVVDKLLRAGADIEAGEGEAGTPLHLAALHGNCNIIAMLTGRGANVNASSREHGPVINAAILSGTVKAVKQIMEGDVRFDLDYTKCDAPLSLSARMSEPSLFRDILDTGREKWLQNRKLIDQALIEASYNGRLESLRVLLKFSQMYTHNIIERAIRSAALEKHWTSVKELLDFATARVAVNDRGEIQLDEPFCIAATGREERIDVLDKIWTFTNHAITQDTLDLSLYQAIVLKKDNVVDWLLKTGSNPNALRDRTGPLTSDAGNAASSTDYSNSLDAAADTGNADVVQALIGKGANVDAEQGYALQLAASQGHVEVVQILLQHGASPNRQVPDNDALGFSSSTALQAACENNRPDVVEALIRRGADVNLGGGPLTNPITAATQGSQDDVLRLLLQAPGIDVNVTGGDDRSTPLINAAKHMSTQCVELLLQAEADVNALDAAKDTALIKSAARGDKACVELLCDHGADVTYRSPHRGLAFDVAAGALHPVCAHVLAEKLSETFENYREKGLADLSNAKKALDGARAELKDRDASIEGLSAQLGEAKEQLDIANKDVEMGQLEKERALSEFSLHGETYESIGQQMRMVKFENRELEKQLDAQRGQTRLAKDTTTRLQASLDEERTKNAELRKKSAWASLEAEKQAAVDMVQQERQAAAELSTHEKQQREQQRKEMGDKIRALEEDVTYAKQQLDSSQKYADAMVEAIQTERGRSQELQGEKEILQASVRDLEETVTSFQAAAARSRTVVRANNATPSALDASANGDYFPSNIAETMEPATDGRSSGGNNRISLRRYSRKASNDKALGTSSPPMASPPSMSPMMTPGSPPPNARSPGSQAEGFRTIHGQHRPNGALGGYRNPSDRRPIPQNTDDELYETSIRNGSAGKEHLSSKGSVHSSNGSKTGSSEGWADAGVGGSNGQLGNGEGRRVVWG